MAKPHSAVHIEENGVMYMTKRISANHKITIPMRKRKGNLLEKCKIEGMPVENFSSSSGSSNSSSGFTLLEGHANMLDNSVSPYSKQDEYIYNGSCNSFPISCIGGMRGMNENSQNTVPYFKNVGLLSPQASADQIYSQNRNMNYLMNGSRNRFQDLDNQYPPLMMDNPVTKHYGNDSQTKVLMPNYYHYNKQIMSQIVKQLQITIQNILQRNSDIYSCYETGSQNGWEVHNPKDGPVIIIQFKDNKKTEEDHMNLFHPEMNTFMHTNTKDYHDVSEQDKLPQTIKKFSSFPVAKKSTASRQPKIKSCFVKINKLSEDELTPYINEKEFDSDGQEYMDDDVDLTNECMKCNQTFKLRIQLAHHKCISTDDEMEDSLGNNLSNSDEVDTGGETTAVKNENEFLIPVCPSYDLPPQNEDDKSAFNPDQVIKSEKVVPLTEIENIIMNPELTIYEMNDDESMSHLQQSLYCSKCVNCKKEVVGKDGEYCERCEMEGSLNSNEQDEFINVDAKKNSLHATDVSQKTKETLQANYQECPYCKKRFSPYYSLKYHTSKCDKNTHCFCKLINLNNESSFVQCYLCAGKNEIEVMCRVCEKTFSNNNKLRRHMVIHSGVKRYICSQCGKRFGRSDHLKLHKQTHLGTKPYMCSTCGKCFTTKQSVKFHMRLHSGVKPYSCNLCGKRFVQLAALKTHLQVHSSNKTYQRPKT